jgi:hypothetical protein
MILKNVNATNRLVGLYFMEDLYLLKVNRETIADESYLSNKF